MVWMKGVGGPEEVSKHVTRNLPGWTKVRDGVAAEERPAGSRLVSWRGCSRASPPDLDTLSPPYNNPTSL